MTVSYEATLQTTDSGPGLWSFLTNWVRDVPVNAASRVKYDPQTVRASLAASERSLVDVYVEAWLDDTQWLSSIGSMKRSRYFRLLVDIGEPSAQHVLDRLTIGDIRPQWFPLLKEVLGVDPVPPAKRGVVSEMADEWLNWARENSFV